VYGCKILARLLVSHGPRYTAIFAGSKTGGFWVMAQRLKSWWDIPTIWPICLCILFGKDVAEVDFERTYDFFSLLEIFGKSSIMYPQALHIIAAMLQQGLRDALKYQDDPDSPAEEQTKNNLTPRQAKGHQRSRSKSMSLTEDLNLRSRCAFLILNDYAKPTLRHAYG
jgi:beige protein homolog 1